VNYEQPEAAPTQINVVLNWIEDLKRRVPTRTKRLNDDR